MKLGDVVRFYDEFVKHQQRVAFNERHRFLYRILREEGLRKDSRVLEVGCGIGVMTALMASRVKSGRILSIDISEASVMRAKEAVRGASGLIDVVVGDATSFRANSEDFDFVTLLDVLEHIPLDRHEEVFKTVATHTGPRTKVIINIPTPEYNEYLRRHEPRELQIIDEVIPADVITRHAYKRDLVLQRFMTYGIWYEDQYQVMTFRRRQTFEKAPMRQRKIHQFRERARLVYGNVRMRIRSAGQ